MPQRKNVSNPLTPREEPQLKLPHKEAAEKIQKQIDEGEQMLLIQPRSKKDLDELWSKKKIWFDYCTALLRSLFTSERIAIEFSAFHGSIATMSPYVEDQVPYLRDSIQGSITQLRSILGRLDLYTSSGFPAQVSTNITGVDSSSEPLQRITNLCTRFHKIARQLSKRRAGRHPFEVENEYDVQDLIHALLWVDFEDVRPEENTPSHAGKSARMDFLLKREQIVIEIKMASTTLNGKDVGDQLAVDVQRYSKHPDCKILVCFIYDPDGHIANPRGLEQDLSREEPTLSVLVLVRP